MTTLAKISLIFVCSITFNVKVFSQSTGKVIQPDPDFHPENKNLYGIEYELIDYSFQLGDSSILTAFDIKDYIHLRERFNDKEIELSDLGITVLLYSREKVYLRLKEEKNVDDHQSLPLNNN